jgi:large subunit ribosomal protein L33
MAKKARQVIILECSECHERNYATTKNIKTQKERLEFKKYCPRCRKRTLHKESK